MGEPGKGDGTPDHNRPSTMSDSDRSFTPTSDFEDEDPFFGEGPSPPGDGSKIALKSLPNPDSEIHLGKVGDLTTCCVAPPKTQNNQFLVLVPAHHPLHVPRPFLLLSCRVHSLPSPTSLWTYMCWGFAGRGIWCVWPGSQRQPQPAQQPGGRGQSDQNWRLRRRGR